MSARLFSLLRVPARTLQSRTSAASPPAIISAIPQLGGQTRHFHPSSRRFDVSQTPSSRQGFTPIARLPTSKLQITFTCTAPQAPAPSPSAATSASNQLDRCNHRSTHTFSRISYEKGVVLIRCPSCRNRHLIADHLGYFETVKSGGLGVEPGEGQYGSRTVEDLMREKGEVVKRGWLVEQGEGETVEILQEETVQEVSATSAVSP
ncbi:zf-DNL-domain-containing protein [Atractiella rhizophila]|nr:zf-DNL-domain-containing protein [Atractiella rhizophila]